MTTPIRQTMAQEVAEGGSALLTGTFKDELGNPVPLVSIGTVQLWLYDEASDAAINGKTATNIKNASGGTIGATDGSLSLVLGPLDNPILDATKRRERHIAFVKATYNGGAGVVEAEAVISVRNLSRVP